MVQLNLYVNKLKHISLLTSREMHTEEQMYILPKVYYMMNFMRIGYWNRICISTILFYLLDHKCQMKNIWNYVWFTKKYLNN